MCRVLDHETFTYNLTAANLAGPDTEPAWYSLYSGKQVSANQKRVSSSFYPIRVRQKIVSGNLSNLRLRLQPIRTELTQPIMGP